MKAIGKRAELTKVRTREFGVIGPGRHGHESGEVEVGQGSDFGGERFEGGGIRAVLAVLFGEFGLDHDVERAAQLTEAAGEFGGIDGLDDVEEFAGAFRLVGLEVADEVEAGAVEVADCRSLGLELLNVVFAELAETECVGFEDGIGREDFGDGEERNLGAAAAGAGAGVGDTLFDGGEAISEGGGSHEVHCTERREFHERKRRTGALDQ